MYICNECIRLCNDILEQEQQASPPGTQLPAWEAAMTDEEILALLPRISSVSAQTDASLQRLVTVLRGRAGDLGPHRRCAADHQAVRLGAVLRRGVSPRPRAAGQPARVPSACH